MLDGHNYTMKQYTADIALLGFAETWRRICDSLLIMGMPPSGICTTRNLPGLYRLGIEISGSRTSGFRYDYAASTNKVYKKELDLRFARVMNGVTNRVCLTNDEYLVYRVRTQTNEFGQVTHANYGRIGEGVSQQIALSMRSWFNPKDNDTNLENARAG